MLIHNVIDITFGKEIMIKIDVWYKYKFISDCLDIEKANIDKNLEIQRSCFLSFSALVPYTELDLVKFV